MEGYDPGDSRYSHQPTDTTSWWKGDDVSRSPHIVISLKKQRAFFYKAGELVGESAISSGDENHRTPTGRFTITQKDMWHLSSQYGDYVDSEGVPIQQNIDRFSDPMPPGAKYDGAKMYYFMRIVRGIGMHAGYLPGYPASHGCIRLPDESARFIFENAPRGTVVQVVDALAVTPQPATATLMASAK